MENTNYRANNQIKEEVYSENTSNAKHKAQKGDAQSQSKHRQTHHDCQIIHLARSEYISIWAKQYKLLQQETSDSITTRKRKHKTKTAELEKPPILVLVIRTGRTLKENLVIFHKMHSPKDDKAEWCSGK
eukprot:954116-Heterocapsa_arctica.AAC.1